MSDWEIVAEVVKTIGAAATGAGFCLSYFALRKEYGWRRKRFTVDLFLRSSGDHSRANLELLAKAFPALLTPKPGKGPTEQECDEILKAMPGDLFRGDIDGFRLRRAIMDEFNAIEPIAMAYHYGLVDLEVIDKSVGTVVLRRYAFFKDFLHATKRLRGDDPWPLIPSLVACLKRERERRGEAALD